MNNKLIDTSALAEVKKYVDQNKYILPTASNETLGGIKVGDNLNIDENGVLSAGSSSKYSFTEIYTKETKAMFKAWRQEILDTGVIPPITYNQGRSYMLYLADVYISGTKVDSVNLRFKGKESTGEFSGYRVYYLPVNFNTTTGEVSSYSNAWNAIEYDVVALNSMSPNKYQALTTNNTTAYIPTTDYHPATKKYVDDTVSSALGDISTVLSTLTTVSEVTE